MGYLFVDIDIKIITRKSISVLFHCEMLYCFTAKIFHSTKPELLLLGVMSKNRKKAALFIRYVVVSFCVVVMINRFAVFVRHKCFFNIHC